MLPWLPEPPSPVTTHVPSLCCGIWSGRFLTRKERGILWLIVVSEWFFCYPDPINRTHFEASHFTRYTSDCFNIQATERMRFRCSEISYRCEVAHFLLHRLKSPASRAPRRELRVVTVPTCTSRLLLSDVSCRHRYAVTPFATLPVVYWYAAQPITLPYRPNRPVIFSVSSALTPLWFVQTMLPAFTPIIGSTVPPASSPHCLPAAVSPHAGAAPSFLVALWCWWRRVRTGGWVGGLTAHPAAGTVVPVLQRLGRLVRRTSGDRRPGDAVMEAGALVERHGPDASDARASSVSRSASERACLADTRPTDRPPAVVPVVRSPGACVIRLTNGYSGVRRPPFRVDRQVLKWSHASAIWRRDLSSSMSIWRDNKRHTTTMMTSSCRR